MVEWWTTRRILAAFWGALLVLAASCVPDVTSTAVPTEVLIPSTATPTSAPTLIPSITPSPLPRPQDVVASATMPEDTLIDRALIDRVIDDLAQTLTVSPDEVLLLSAARTTWTTLDLGCNDALRPVPMHTEGYRLLLRVGGKTYEYHTDTHSRIRRCTGQVEVSDAIPLIEIDPLAAELVGLAQQRVALNLDLPVRRVRLVDIQALTWPDTSLGCPLPNQRYTSLDITGYRIVLAVGEQEYIFHTDTERLIPCAARDERLPTPELETTPER